jgi:hypothetical protein
MPHKGFLALSVLVNAAFAATWFYISNFDGWARAGASILLLMPVILSLVLLGFIVEKWLDKTVTGKAKNVIIASFVIASPPSVWFLWRLLLFFS